MIKFYNTYVVFVVMTLCFSENDFVYDFYWVFYCIVVLRVSLWWVVLMVFVSVFLNRV